MYSQIQKRYRILRWSSQGIVFVLPSTREVLLNVTNELYETDVYNVMGIIKGSTYPGKLSHSTRECQLSRITLTLVLSFSTLYSFNKPTKIWNKWKKILNLWQRWDGTHELHIIWSRLFNRLRFGARRERFLGRIDVMRRQVNIW